MTAKKTPKVEEKISEKGTVKTSDSWNSPYVYWAICVILLIFIAGLVYWYFNREGSVIPDEPASIAQTSELSNLFTQAALTELPEAAENNLEGDSSNSELVLLPAISDSPENSFPVPPLSSPPADTVKNPEAVQMKTEPHKSEEDRRVSEVAPQYFSSTQEKVDRQPGPSKMEQLIMQRVVMDDIFRKIENGQPFLIDFDIMLRWIKDAHTRASILALEPYASKGIGSLDVLAADLHSLLAHEQLEKPSDKDSAVSRFFKSIVRVSKKSNAVPQLEKALSDKDLSLSVKLAKQLINEGYDLKKWLDQLETYIKLRKEVESIKNIIHYYLRTKLLELTDTNS